MLTGQGEITRKREGQGKGEGKVTRTIPMTGDENGIQGKTGTITTETVIGRETGTGKETVIVTVLLAETRERERECEKDYERASHERDRGHTQERDAEYTSRSMTKSRMVEDRDTELEPGEHDYIWKGMEWYGEHAKHGHGQERDYNYNEKYMMMMSSPMVLAIEPEIDRERLKPEYYGDQYDEGDPDQREEGEAVGDHDYGYGYQHSGRSHSRS